MTLLQRFVQPSGLSPHRTRLKLLHNFHLNRRRKRRLNVDRRRYPLRGIGAEPRKTLRFSLKTGLVRRHWLRKSARRRQKAIDADGASQAEGVAAFAEAHPDGRGAGVGGDGHIRSRGRRGMTLPFARHANRHCSRGRTDGSQGRALRNSFAQRRRLRCFGALRRDYIRLCGELRIKDSRQQKQRLNCSGTAGTSAH